MNDEREREREDDLPIEADRDYRLARLVYKGAAIAGEDCAIAAMRHLGIREEVIEAVVRHE